MPGSSPEGKPFPNVDSKAEDEGEDADAEAGGEGETLDDGESELSVGGINCVTLSLRLVLDLFFGTVWDFKSL